MELPADQRLLYRDLVAKLDSQNGEAQLIHYMGGVLNSLLRRKGDAEFLCAVQDAFTTGLAGRPWAEQITLAREVIGLVITKRPEVALAWQTLHNEKPTPYQRRAADQEELAPVPDLDDLPDFSLTPEEDELEPAPTPVATPEEEIADYVAGVLERRLALFEAPAQRVPSPAYAHEQPFFLFSPQFAQVTRRFVARVLIPLVRTDLGRMVIDQLPPDALSNAEAQKAALAEKRPEIWTILLARLSHLAADLHAAEVKLAAAQNGPVGPEFQTVEVPVKTPRVLRVLGVAFTLGSRTETKRVKVRVNPSNHPTNEEMLALDVITKWRDMAAREGIDLPPACGFALLRTLLDLDPEAYKARAAELMALAVSQDTPREVIIEQMRQANATMPPDLADALAITLFYHGIDGAFGFQELFELAMEWGPTRPFLPAEIARRPRDLAFQIRDCLRRRVDRNSLGLSIVMLFEVWRVLDRARCAAAMDAAITVFSAFPVAFAGDKDEKTFTEIGAVLHRTLSAETLDAANTIEDVLKLYGKVVAGR